MVGLSLSLCRVLLILVVESGLIMLNIEGDALTIIFRAMLIPLLFIGLTIIHGEEVVGLIGNTH